MSGPLALALVHYPVLDGAGSTITSALTNIDVHDVARSCRTFGLERFYVVTPVTAQRDLVSAIRGHWVGGAGGDRIPARTAAIERVEPVESLAAARASFAERVGAEPRLWATAANPKGRSVMSFGEAQQALGDPPPTLLVFGTAHGLADEAFDGCDALLAPISGLEGPYNHLSVRSAVAIILDRLLAARD